MPKLIRMESEVVVADVPRIEWRERSLIFKLNSRVYCVASSQYGTLAVHDTLSPDSNKLPVTITHRPSKLMVARLSDRDEATVQTEWLWNSCPRAWCEDDVDKSLIPDEVMQWLLAHQR